MKYDEELAITSTTDEGPVIPAITTDDTLVLQQKKNRSNQSRLERGTRVSGSHGNLVLNPKGHSRRIRARIYGCIAESGGNDKYLVHFECEIEKECTSNTLRQENAVTAAISLEEIFAPKRDQLIATGKYV